MKPSSPLLARLALAAALAALAVPGAVLAWRVLTASVWLAARQPKFVGPFTADGIWMLATVVGAVVAAAALACAAGAVAAFMSGGLALRLVRCGFIVSYLAMAAWAILVVRGVGTIGRHRLTVDELPQDSVTLFKLAWSLIGPALLPLAMAIVGHVASWRSSTIGLFTGREPGPRPPIGDRIAENVRTGGRDPRFRRSWLTSFWGHLLVIVIIPWLVTYIGCRERYNVPHGSGEEAVAAVVQVAKPIKKKKKRYLLNLNSAIILTKPDIDKDSDVEEKVETETQLTYVADATTVGARAAGKLGKGGGKEGGWPDGVGRDPIRFLRIKHGGPLWDDGMDEVSRADVNFLDQFSKVTGFKVARVPEARTIQQLRNFDKGFAPPFLYLTGAGAIPVTSRDVAVLRDYLLGGGMLFADAGSPQFHNAFRGLMAAVFPDRQLVVIADDDPIFQGPFAFPNGAPPLWHHGGSRALGIKHQKRWAVFYHPGDINDAWKTGHSGMGRDLADQSYKLGVNILYHAFTNYLDQTRKHRK